MVLVLVFDVGFLIVYLFEKVWVSVDGYWKVWNKCGVVFMLIEKSCDVFVFS